MIDGEFAVAVTSADGVVTAWSEQAQRLLGYPAADILGRRATDLLGAALASRISWPPAEPRPWSGQVAVRHSDGSRRQIQLGVYPLQDGAGQAQWFLAGVPAGVPASGPRVADPGTAQREDLRELLDWAITQSPVHTALFDTQLRQVRLNEAMVRELGLDSEAAGIGLQMTDILPDPEVKAFSTSVRQVARTGKPLVWKGTAPGLTPSRERSLEVTLSPVKDPDGQVRGIFTIGFDVTEERLGRERLALVNEASRRIGSTLDVTRTAEELVEVAVPQLADFVMIDLLDSVLRGDEPTTGPLAGSVPIRRMAIGSVLDNSPEAVIRPGQISSYPEQSQAARCLETGRSVLFNSTAGEVGRWAEHDPVRAARVQRYRFHSVMTVPVRARGVVLGIAIFVRHERPEPFEDDDLVLAEEIVARAAVCIDNARRFAREHATALTLQRSLLPRRLPAQAAVQVATRYLPAGPSAAVGGDWFDVIRLSGSRVGLVVGDVVGHGIRAAATMGRLRTAVRTLADIDLEPGELLTRLDDVVTGLADEERLAPDDDSAGDLSATCLYAVYDPVSRCCTLARAGHPLPVVVDPGGTAEFLDLPAGPPLGLGGLPFEQAELQLAEGSLIVLYTDGLIESRQRDIGTGLSAMRKILAEVHLQPGGPPHPPPSLEAICDTVVGQLLPDQAEDDAALLIARTRALPADQIVTWELPAETSGVADARGRASRQAAAWGLEEATFTTELIVGELVTNAICHGAAPIQLRMILDGALICEVSDASSTAPHLRRADRDDEGGRGLLLVAQLTERWGTRHTRAGKTIWAEQPLAAASARAD